MRQEEANQDEKQKIMNLLSSIEMNYNNTPIKIPEHGGVIASIHFLPILD